MSSNGKVTREFTLDDDIRKHNISRIYVIDDKLLNINNAKAKPITCLYDYDRPQLTIDKLRNALVEADEYNERSIEEIKNWFLRAWFKDEKKKESTSSEGNEEDSRERGKELFIQKYTKGIPAIEAILIDGKPMLLQIIDGKAKLSEKTLGSKCILCIYKNYIVAETILTRFL